VSLQRRQPGCSHKALGAVVQTDASARAREQVHERGEPCRGRPDACGQLTGRVGLISAEQLVATFAGTVGACDLGAETAYAAGLPANFTLPPSTPAQVVTAIDYALAQLGKPYVYGGTGPDSWDCSGLTQAAMAAAGISIPRTSEEQAAAATPVSMNALEPGDLLFWSTDGTAANAYHVAIYIGNGEYVEAANPSAGVKTDTIADYTPSFAGRF